MHESRHDVITAIVGAVVLFAVTFPPALLWAASKHLAPRWVRDLPATSRAAAVNAVLTAAAVFFLLTSAPASEATS
jgi:hypothetical protein